MSNKSSSKDVEEIFAEVRKQLADEPVLDLNTLKTVHDYLEFEFEDILYMDAWLHAHIIKAMEKRKNEASTKL